MPSLELISFNTDGVLFEIDKTENLDGTDIGTNMGQWKLDPKNCEKIVSYYSLGNNVS